eukprot:TRINITY_DN24189_c0_g1_i1.p1 TRINITY_DN24189_c0_g1~~TRINITY_DN24189_c0_g1_i1.p1  ORF type:complete len:301 (+),score=47.28 TRINITY_DN24189_c0_g1_i1:157-1059(+)
MMVRTIKVSNVSTKAAEPQIIQFFSFSGDVVGVTFSTEPESRFKSNRVAYVTFRDARALDTALLLTGTLIEDLPILVEVNEDPHLGSEGPKDEEVRGGASRSSGMRKAETMVASLLASGYILSKDALEKAREYDEKHKLTQKAAIQASAIDQKYSVSKKFQETSATVGRSLSSVDETYHVSSNAKAIAAAAGSTLSEAGKQMMANRYVASGRDWIAGAFGTVSQVVGDVAEMAKTKVEKAERKRQGVNDAGPSGEATLLPAGATSSKPSTDDTVLLTSAQPSGLYPKLNATGSFEKTAGA